MAFGDESVRWLLLHANEYAISLNSQDARAYDLYAETSIRGGVQTWDVHDVIDLQVRYENLVLL